MSIYNITDYGAVPDGSLCTKAIQRAIDLCDSGGTVLIPEGTFVTGALFLKSNMTLHLQKGARLMASEDIADFPLMGYPFEGRDSICYASLINTDGAPHKNITIEGEGVINANGTALYSAELSENKGKRGRAICIRNTENLTLRGITVRQSPAWCLHLIYCINVTIEGIQIHTKYDENGNRCKLHNGDGIDLDSCQGVHVSNCLISSQDDCIAIKSGRNEEGRRVGIPSCDILIEHCKFTSGFGIAIGSEMSGGVENVAVKNCVFENTYSIASIKAVRGRGGYVRNISYENCTHFNHSTEHRDCEWFRGAIYMDGFYGQVEFDSDKTAPIDEGTPEVDGITLKNITLETTAGNAIYICGLPEKHYKNVRLENIRAHGKRGMIKANLDGAEFINVDVTSDE